VHDWQSFWVEIWVSTPETTTPGVAEAMVDLQYSTDYLTAMEIVHGPAFSVNPSGVIDDIQGLVSGLGGRTQLTDVGDDAYVLLARVRFASTGDDQVPVDEVGRNIGPYDMQMALAGGQTELVDVGPVVPALGGSPATQLWAAMYDIDDNNQTDFGDLSYFAAAFGRTVGAPADEPPFVWWADFDRSGRVDFGDLAFFAPNFGKTRAAVQAGDQTLIFPSNFPDAWRAGTGAGQGEGESEGEGEARRCEGAWKPMADGVRLAAGSDGWRHASALPRQLAWAVDEAHAALLLEVSQGSSQGRMGYVTEPAVPMRHKSPLLRHSRNETPVGTSLERPDRRFEDWEPLEDLLASLAESPTDRFSADLLDPHEAFFSRLGG
jgi:hypothetical protein